MSTAVTEKAEAENSEPSAWTVLGILVGLVALVFGVIWGIGSSYEHTQEIQQTNFENVLNLTNEELGSKSVDELVDARETVLTASNYSIGYSDTVVNRELGQIDQLILEKTDR